MATESHIHHPNYVKIWAILVALLIVSVVGSMSSIRWIVLIAAFGVALVKAYLVARNFMHINVEKRFVPYLLIICLAFMVILLAAVSPDVMHHSGQNWENNAAKQAVESGLQNAQNMSSQSTIIESGLPPSVGDGGNGDHGGNGGKRLPNSVLGMIIFIVAEVMFFAALMSAHTIARSSAMGGVWPPPGQPRLPVERTAVNTAILLFSGVLLWIANRRMKTEPGRALRFLAGAIATGMAFVLLQGVEWVRLLREGLTMTSSNHGAFFYLIVGTHALHAVAAIVALTWVYLMMRRGTLALSTFTATQFFWYFVVLLWPVIYLRVYL